MSQFFFRTPFATSGDTDTVPNDIQPDGSVSYTQGFGVDYELSPSDVDVLYPERPIINDLFKVITGAIQILQVHGFPDFITSSDNGGSPYPYDKNSCVRYSDGVVYYSLVNSNTALPTDTTKWLPLFPVSAFQTGMTIMHEDTTLPAGGWVWANGTTVGNASSNATGRANADTSALFTQIWNAFPNSIRPIVNSNGTPGTRGVSAAADYAANKALPVRDMRGNVPAGWTTMGGTSASGNLAQTGGFGVDGSIFGATGGEGTGHTPTLSEMFAHTHGSSGMSVVVGNHQHLIANTNSINPGTQPVDSAHALATIGRITGGTDNSYSLVNTTTNGGNATANVGLSSPQINSAPSTISGGTDSAGSSTSFNVVQPTTICNFITKL